MRCVKRFAVHSGLAVSACCAVVVPTALLFAQPAANEAQPTNLVLVLVNDQPITENDLALSMLARSVPEDQRQKLRKRFLEQLVDRRLMRDYLISRKAQADPLELDAQVSRIRKLIAKAGDDPDAVLRKMGFDENRLRDELSLPLAWQTHIARVLTAEGIRDYFAAHREQFDGTQIRASQIFLKLGESAGDADKEQDLQRLRDIRMEIVSGKTTFAAAAGMHSEAPSRDQGGDVGTFAYRGTMPLEFTREVFPLKVGEVGEPFLTRFGAHLATVTERKPGELSLEDVRPLVLSQMSGELWDETVAQERQKADFRWSAEFP